MLVSQWNSYILSLRYISIYHMSPSLMKKVHHCYIRIFIQQWRIRRHYPLVINLNITSKLNDDILGMVSWTVATFLKHCTWRYILHPETIINANVVYTLQCNNTLV